MNSNGHQSMDEEAAVSIAAMSKGLMDSRGSSDNNNIENRTTGEREVSRLIRAQNSNNDQLPQNNMSRSISYEKENQHNSDHTTAVVDQQQSNNNVSKSPTSRGLIRNGAAAFASVDIPQPEERNSSEEMVHEDDNDSRLQGVRLSYFDEESSSTNNNIMAGVTRVDNPDVSNNNNQYNSQYDDEEENEYDDCSSDASGQTVVHNDCPVPPVNATQEEINRFYWEWCYGKIDNDSDDSSVAAVKGNNNVLKNGGLGIRTAPAKSCLSTKKKDSNVGANRPSTESISPRRLLHNSPPETNDNDISFTSATDQQQQINEFDSPEQEDLTPKNNITRLGASTTDLVNKRRSQSAVKFGTNTAAEFDFLRPITEMTPIPLSVVQEIFPTDVKEEPEEKEIEHRQTAQNVAILAEWEEDFDDIISDDNDIVKPGGRSMKRGRKRTPHKRPRKRRESSSSRRRESSIFSRERRSLIDPDDSMEMDDDLSGDTGNNNPAAGRRRSSMDGGLPFSVTCDPEDYTSPSAGSVSTMGTPAGLAAIESNKANTTKENNAAQAKQDSVANRDSLDSACISPNSLKSSLVAEVNCNKTDSSMVDSSFESVDHSTAMAGIMPGDTSFESIDDNGRDSNETNITARATPNSARTSSSTILRAVHASGALLPGNNNYSHSPHHQSNHNAAPSTSANNGGSGDAGNGRLRPNHLKYSPSSSSGASSTCPGRMDTSPSDSYSSLGSDIMSLFTHHSIDDTKASPNNSPLHLSKQLSVLSAHPIMPYHTNISDLIQLSQSSTQHDKVPLTFMNEHLMRGVSPSTSLALIVHEMMNGSNEINQSMFCGNSEWLNLAFSNETKSKLAETSFESMLMNEVKEMTANRITPTHSRPSSTMTDVDLHTISSCIQQFHTVSCLDWSSMEIDVATRALSKSQEWAELMNNKTEECHKFVASCCKKLAETSALAMAQLTKPNATKLKLQKRKVQSQIESKLSIVKNLEDQLAVEVDRLQQAKRVKRLFDAHLNIERHSPISALTEEIRTVVTPTPITVNASDFTFSLLDGAAEIVMKIELDDDEVDNTMTEIGCFIKDGGASIQLLQAILMGNLQQKVDENLGPYQLRASLSKMILESESREELFLQLSHIVSRIDALVRSVRVLETTRGFCVVNATEDGNVTLSVSMSLEGHEGVVVQTTFLFSNLLDEDWCVTTVPDSVKVSVVSSVEGEDLSSVSSQLQEKTQSILLRAGSSRSNCDPILLRRICSELIC